MRAVLDHSDAVMIRFTTPAIKKLRTLIFHTRLRRNCADQAQGRRGAQRNRVLADDEPCRLHAIVESECNNCLCVN